MNSRHLIFGLTCVLCMVSTSAFAYSPLVCEAGMPVAGTSLLNEGNVCQYVGIQYMFSTVMCQFISMVNVLMGKFYCSIQGAVTPILGALLTVFIAISGLQTLTGTIQFSMKELLTRVLKLTIVYWLVADPTRGVSAGVAFMFDFFIGFIADTTRWVVSVLDDATGHRITGGNPSDVGIVNTFRFIDEMIFMSFAGNNTPSLTGLKPQDNAKVIGFFISLLIANQSLVWLVVSFAFSIIAVLMRTLIAFLIAVVSIAFLMGLSPIFISFILFQATFQYFDIWIRFMASYCLQVMITFAILALYLYSLTLFSPFFQNLAQVVFPYQKGERAEAPSIWGSSNKYGICPLGPLGFSNGQVTIRCKTPGFAGGPDVVGPGQLQKMSEMLFFLFYNMISLVLISFGFNTLQKNTGHLARQLAGPAFVPMINSKHIGMNSFRALKQAKGEVPSFMGRGGFKGFNHRHQTVDDNPETRGVDSFMQQMKKKVTKR